MINNDSQVEEKIIKMDLLRAKLAKSQTGNRDYTHGDHNHGPKNTKHDHDSKNNRVRFFETILY